MKHGHATGTKRHRRPRRATTQRLEAMGREIAARLAQMPPAELLK